MTTQNLLTEWLENYQKEHIKARTYSRYQGLITMHIVPTLGKKTLRNSDGERFKNFSHSRRRMEIYATEKNFLPQVQI